MALHACAEISERRWPLGLEHAGWSIYLVLFPFYNHTALMHLFFKPLSLKEAKTPSLQLLPARLAYVSLFGLALQIAGLIARFVE